MLWLVEEPEFTCQPFAISARYQPATAALPFAEHPFFQEKMMSFAESRREFMLGSARAGAALAVVAASGGALGAFATELLPSAEGAMTPAPVSPELLHALGSRIGLEVAGSLGGADAPVSLAYIDAAGPSADALREGIERGIQWHAGSAPALREWQAPYCSLLGAALITNEATGQQAVVEIDTNALSMIAMVESVKTPASAYKHAVLTVSADNLYRVRFL